MHGRSLICLLGLLGLLYLQPLPRSLFLFLARRKASSISRLCSYLFSVAKDLFRACPLLVFYTFHVVDINLHNGLFLCWTIPSRARGLTSVSSNRSKLVFQQDGKFVTRTPRTCRTTSTPRPRNPVGNRHRTLIPKSSRYTWLSTTVPQGVVLRAPVKAMAKFAAATFL